MPEWIDGDVGVQKDGTAHAKLEAHDCATVIGIAAPSAALAMAQREKLKRLLNLYDTGIGVGAVIDIGCTHDLIYDQEGAEQVQRDFLMFLRGVVDG